MSRNSNHHFEIEPSGLRILIRHRGEILADSHRAVLLHEFGSHDYAPIYYLPRSDVRMELLSRSETTTRCPIKGIASYWTVTDEAGNAVSTAWSYEETVAGAEAIQGFVAFDTSVVNLDLSLGETA